MPESMEERLDALNVWAKILVVVVPIVFGAGGAWATFSIRLGDVEESIFKHEAQEAKQQEKIDTMRDQVRDMTKDLDYIKKSLDKNDKSNEEILRLLRKKG